MVVVVDGGADGGLGGLAVAVVGRGAGEGFAGGGAGAEGGRHWQVRLWGGQGWGGG